MLKYILKRLGQSLLTILLVVSVVFVLMRLMPSENFFTDDELLKFTDKQKFEKLERMGMMKVCPTCISQACSIGFSYCPIRSS